MASKKSLKSTSQQDPTTLGKRERDRLMCYRFAQLRNASAVGAEFGVSRMYVSRLWDRITNEEREMILDTSKEVVEDLNKKIITAEKIAGDEFIANVVKAREMAGRELIRRFTGKDIRMISNKDFSSLLKLVSDIAVNKGNETEIDPINSTFRQHREAIRNEIDNFKK
ncbi:MAG: hypothetical protein RR330_05430 [Alistipes sp.]